MSGSKVVYGKLRYYNFQIFQGRPKLRPFTSQIETVWRLYSDDFLGAINYLGDVSAYA